MAKFYVDKIDNIRKTIASNKEALKSALHVTAYEFDRAKVSTFSEFTKITVSELLEHMQKMNNKSCSKDPIPTTI